LTARSLASCRASATLAGSTCRASATDLSSSAVSGRRGRRVELRRVEAAELGQRTPRGAQAALVDRVRIFRFGPFGSLPGLGPY
jgi:hypothetical protein